MTSVTAYIASAADSPLAKGTIERRALGPHDVLIDIAFVGICHSDIHIARNEWKDTDYPVVPGHEITGIVADVGSNVTRIRPGDRVGVGCMVNSCGQCAACAVSEEQYCEAGVVMTYNSTDDGERTYGGYSEKIVVTDRFVLNISDALPLDAAAPLLCAGITLYSPLKHWGAGPSTKVAIVGMGGLGHVGVKIAHALGADVTVLSQSTAKAEDGMKFGADRYFATADPATFTKLHGYFDLILNTVSSNVDLNTFLDLLAINGTLVDLGIPENDLTVHPRSLVSNRRSLASSMAGGTAETQEMLNFCADHGIVADIEIIAADAINEAFKRIIASDVRYRFVIDIATMTS